MGEHRQCAKLMNRTGYLRLMPCRKPATKKEDGKWWCSAHAPSGRAQREKAERARWEAAEAKRQHGYALHAARDEILKAAREWRRANVVTDKTGALAAAVDALVALESEGE